MHAESQQVPSGATMPMEHMTTPALYTFMASSGVQCVSVQCHGVGVFRYSHYAGYGRMASLPGGVTFRSLVALALGAWVAGTSVPALAQGISGSWPQGGQGISGGWPQGGQGIAGGWVQVGQGIARCHWQNQPIYDDRGNAIGRSHSAKAR